MTQRTYENGIIRVVWDSSLCIHTGICLSTGQGVFDVTRRPWVDLDAADAEVAVGAIEACPSGALRYERLDGAQGEVPDVPTTIVPWPNGPLLVRGEIDVRDRHDEVFTASPRAALCRCGTSKNQPFCDLSHKKSGFHDYPRVHGHDRETASSPSDVSREQLD
jgi:uncharacterized Fe-S cluster protein YjdI/CDGSH-type Zn-finger protein